VGDAQPRRVDHQVLGFQFQPGVGQPLPIQHVAGRFISFRDLWDKAMRSREEGRPSPFAHGTSQVDRSEEGGRVVHEAAFSNPRSEMDKVEDLYQSLMSARRDAGQEVVPLHRFANFVRDQVKQYQESGDGNVAFRVAVKDGQVSFTVRGGKE
jgi:hypothetical protein|tara:strand:+ start:990 stop:1448 length:459 start_codon:yes stop_codon:yes gene_type:complete